MGNLVRLLARRNAVLVAASSLVLAGFELLICALVTALDLDAILQQVVTAAPPFFSAMIGEQFAGLSVAGIVAFGWNHPVALALGAAVAIVLGARAVAGEIDQGAAELVMTQPFGRGRYLAAHVLFGAFALALVSAAGVAGTAAGSRVFDLDIFTPRDLVAVAFAFWLLQLAWFGIALAVSARGREGGPVAIAVFFVALVAYLIAAIGSVWDPAARFLPLSLYHYYEPREILVEQVLSAVTVAVLAIVAAAGIALGAVLFSRRDVP
ncbi:MAG: ABC transporter permease subunit [Thermoanaerobaculia bacterium]